ncbi:MAG: molybdenum cofactor guanylyltransferase [Gemmataceae bacterium]
MQFHSASKDTVRLAAIVVCGGRSRRMGQPKANLSYDSTTFLESVTRNLAIVASPVVVVAAVGQSLPPLPTGVEVVTDTVPEEGPLRGLATGLSALEGRAEVAFVAACDLPLLTPEFVLRVVAALGDADGVVPSADGRLHPLAAVYRVQLFAMVESILERGLRRMADLFDRANVRQVQFNDAASLRSLTNVNTPEDYAALLASDRR